MDPCECDRRVEIIVHACLKLLQSSRSSLGQSFVPACFRLRFTQAGMKVTQTLNRSLRTCQCVERKIQLLVIRHAEQEVANRSGRETSGRYITISEVVAL